MIIPSNSQSFGYLEPILGVFEVMCHFLKVIIADNKWLFCCCDSILQLDIRVREVDFLICESSDDPPAIDFSYVMVLSIQLNFRSIW